MENDALDIAVARHARQAGLISAEQLSSALAEQARRSQSGSPSSLADVLHGLGYLTDAQRKMVEEKARGKAGSVQQLLHFKLVRKIGEGGMGAVYLSEDGRSGKRVALKVLPKHLSGNIELVKRFRREAQAAIRLDHPHIVRGFEVGEDLGFHFYAMEYCDGQPLDKLLVVENRLPVERALGIVLQVARGLEFAHRSGLIHRDIKPANIFLVQGGPAKILDLGLSKNLEGSQSTFNTVTGAVMGTPHYISPEQANSEKSIDGRTDLYSLGATLYHMLTGEAPFPGSSAMEVMYKHVHDQLPDPRERVADLPERVVELLKRMMAKAPSDRHPDAAALISDLEEVIAGRSPKSAVIDSAKTTIAPLRVAGARAGVPPGTARIKKTPTVRRTVIVRKSSAAPIIGGAAALLAVVIAVLALRPGPKPEPPPPVVRKSPPPPSPAPPLPSTSTSPVPAPVPDPWAAAIDLLPLVEPARDAVSGAWVRSGSEVHSTGKATARIVVPYEPPDEYDLRLAFTPLGETPDLNLYLTASRRTFRWLVGGYRNTVVGAAFLDGQQAIDAVVPRIVRPQGFLRTGVRHVMVVRVRRDRLSADLDGASVLDGKVEYARLSCGPDQALPGGATMGLLSSDCPTRFHRLELLPVTGRGAPRLPDPLPAPPPPAAVAPRDLLRLVDAERDSLAGAWKREADGLVSDQSQPARLQIAYEPPEEYDLRAEFTRRNGNCSTLLFAARSGRTFAVTLGDVGNTVAGFSRLGEIPLEKTPNLVKMSLADGRRYTTLVEVRRDRVALKLDGATLAEWKPPLAEPGTPWDWPLRRDGLFGLGSCHALTTFHKVEVVELSGPGKEVPAPAAPVSTAPLLKPRAVLEAPSACQLAWSRDGKWIAGGGDSGDLVLWDAVAARESSRRPAHAKGVASVAFSPDGKWLVSSGREDGTLRRWATDGKSASRLLATNVAEMPEIAVSPDAARIAGAAREEVVIWDAATGKALRRIPLPAEGSGTVAWAPSGKLLASGSWRKQARILDPESGAVVRTLSGHQEGVVCVRWSPDGKTLASSSADGSIRTWDADSGKPLWKAVSHRMTIVRALVFTPDGKRLVSGGFDSKARVWDVATGSEEFILEGHGNFSVGLAVSPDGKRVASAGANPELLVWDLPGPQEPVWRPLFDGKTLDWLTRQGEGSWKVERGAMVRTEGRAAAQSVETFDDAEFRIRLEATSETEFVGISVRQSERGKLTLALPRQPLSRVVGRPCEILISCRGSEVRAGVDGQAMPLERDGDPRTGHLQITAVGAGVRILSVEVRARASSTADVAKRLRELNPGMEGEPAWDIQGGQVAGCTLLTVNVSDLSPLRALPSLRKLKATGLWIASTQEYQVGGLRSLESLKGLNLTDLEISLNAVSDLSPLLGMRIERLDLSSNPIKSLAPLAGMPLESIALGGTEVSDLRPLAGMKLRGLIAWDTPVEDLAPIRGMPLEVLNLRKAPVKSLEPLRGMALYWLTIQDSAASDLGPLRDMPLREYFGPVDKGVARTWKIIEKINDKPAAAALR
jgi:serine/threonine protein kinase/dipeptidyl aminopeptidase/acylaminoacyl peptidase